jgi:predicted peroxiredoxin
MAPGGKKRAKRRQTMNRLMATLLVAGVVTTGTANAGAEEPTRDGVFIHISHGSDDPHRLLMALNMAQIMADDHDVLVYFDIMGVNAVLKDADDVKFSHFPSSKTQLAALKGKGVILMACPGCLKAAGKTGADLAKGIRVADKKTFFSFTKGRILTLDY